MAHCENNNPVLFDLYTENKHITSDRKVFDGIIDMGGLPDSYVGVTVIIDNKRLVEITEDRSPREGEFKVDYRHGWLYINPDVYNGKTLELDFYSRGIELTPASRIYTFDKNGRVNLSMTLQDYVDMANNSVVFTESDTLSNIASGESFPAILGKISKWYTEKINKLKNLAFKDVVGTSEISNNAVTTNKLADNVVTNNKITDGAVTANKLADSAVTKDKIVNGSVTNNKIADGAVGRNQIIDGAINEQKLDSSVVSLLQDMAPINSPNFTGTPTAPTPGSSNVSEQIATTSFVRNAIALYGSGGGQTQIEIVQINISSYSLDGLGLHLTADKIPSLDNKYYAFSFSSIIFSELIDDLSNNAGTEIPVFINGEELYFGSGGQPLWGSTFESMFTRLQSDKTYLKYNGNQERFLEIYSSDVSYAYYRINKLDERIAKLENKIKTLEI